MVMFFIKKKDTFSLAVFLKYIMTKDPQKVSANVMNGFIFFLIDVPPLEYYKALMYLSYLSKLRLK